MPGCWPFQDQRANSTAPSHQLESLPFKGGRVPGIRRGLFSQGLIFLRGTLSFLIRRPSASAPCDRWGGATLVRSILGPGRRDAAPVIAPGVVCAWRGLLLFCCEGADGVGLCRAKWCTVERSFFVFFWEIICQIRGRFFKNDEMPVSSSVLRTDSSAACSPRCNEPSFSLVMPSSRLACVASAIAARNMSAMRRHGENLPV